MDVITDWKLRLSTLYKIFRIFQNLHLVDAITWIGGITVSLDSIFDCGSTVVRSFDSDFVEHLADPALYLSQSDRGKELYQIKTKTFYIPLQTHYLLKLKIELIECLWQLI